jgi:hypothetical protein
VKQAIITDKGGADLNCPSDLNGLKQMDIEQREPKQLVDLRSVSIDKTLPVPDRMRSFIKQVKNPYLFQVDGIAVKVEFSAGKSLEDTLLTFLLAEKNR